MTDQNPVDRATYDSRAHAALPGVDVSGSYSSRPPAHLIPAAIVPPGDLEADAADAAEDATVAPAVEPPAPVAPREPVKAPAEDGQFTRSYLAKG